jgi:hypothetical protein
LEECRQRIKAQDAELRAAPGKKRARVSLALFFVKRPHPSPSSS